MRRYLTTPIYYVNDRPHIGHAYTTILADAGARWHRLLGRETRFLTGTDEHGQKVQQAAQKRGLSPKAHCDELHQAFKALFVDIEVAYDRFIRTTDDDHRAVVQGALQTLWDQELIYAKEYGGWYSVSEERFWTEKDLVDGKCPDSGNPVEWIEERNYFFKMSAYQEQLVAHIQANPRFIEPEYRKNEVLGFLRQPLEDLCISRPKSRLSWGIELPFDSEYVTYVWFDALLNYLTGIGYPHGEDWQAWWAESIHLLGKDILTTHCVYWTTMLMALKVPLPKRLVAHGWWLMGDSKMSKTKGNVVDPMALKNEYGVEVFRYFLLREMSVGQDASFSEEALIGRNNAELANDLGNLVSRVLSMVQKRFDGRVPPYSVAAAEDDAVLASRDGLAAQVADHVEHFRTHLAIDSSMSLIRQLNKYVTDTAPFRVIKTDPDRAGSILNVVLSGLREAAIWLGPVMPTAMAELLRRIGCLDGAPLAAGAAVDKGSALFPRRDLPQAVEEPGEGAKPEPSATPKKKSKSAPKDTIDFETFMAMDLRVAEITAAERIEGAKKLLKLTVSLGDESRTVVAGIAGAYAPEEVVGRRVVLLANLAPKPIYGIESQGMILAAKQGKKGLFLVSPDGEPRPGSQVS